MWPNRCRFQCPRDIRIGWFVESHVAVADLYEAQLTRSRCLASHLGHLTKAVRLKYTALHDAESSSPRPSHAFQESPPVYSILVVIMWKFVFLSSQLYFLLDLVLLLAHLCFRPGLFVRERTAREPQNRRVPVPLFDPFHLCKPQCIALYSH